MAEDYLYINCSKYFSLNPANGNLKSLCPPSVVVQLTITVSFFTCNSNRFTWSFLHSRILGIRSNISALESVNAHFICAVICPRF